MVRAGRVDKGRCQSGPKLRDHLNVEVLMGRKEGEGVSFT